MSDADDFSDANSQNCDYFDQYGYNGTVFRNPSPPSDGQPYLMIVEQPQSRGFRFRYDCEGKSHGGLQGVHSRKEAKKFPSVKICNYRGAAKVTVSLVTDEAVPRPHANQLIGRTCSNGMCTVQVRGDHQDPVISFPNLSIRHVTKKAVPGILMERIREVYCVDKMMVEGCLGQNVDQIRLTPAEEQQLKHQAELSAKNMPLNVVRLSFRAYLLDENSVCTKVLPPVVSNPIFDSKAPSNAVLKISRMDKAGGSCMGDDEVFILCDKVQKDDIAVRFYEEDSEKNVKWEGFANFSSNDVHKQHAIVFRTPPYARTDIDRPVQVKVQLKRMSDGEISDSKTFCYYPHQSDSDEIQKKKMKHVSQFDAESIRVATETIPRNFLLAVQNTQLQSGLHSVNGHVPVPAAAAAAAFTVQGQNLVFYEAANRPVVATRRLEVDSAPSPQFIQGQNVATNPPNRPVTVPRGLVEDSVPLPEFVGRSFPLSEMSAKPSALGSVVDRNPKLDPALQKRPVQNEQSSRQFQEQGTQTSDTDSSALVTALKQLYERAGQAIHKYSQTGDVRHLLTPTRYMINSSNDDGDNAVHLSVIHSQPGALSNILSVLSTLPSPVAINERNHLLQTPLQLAVVTRQTDIVRLLLTYGAEPRVMFHKQNGDTVLHIAARNGDAVCMELLLHYWNANQKQRTTGTWYPEIDCLNFEGFSALHLAARCGHVDCVRALTKKGLADINLKDGCSGRTALHHAVINNSMPVVACLILECSADVDIPDDSGNTPLHHASMSNLVDMAALLMAAGANPDAENCDYSNSDSDTDEENLTETKDSHLDEEQTDDDDRQHSGMTPRDLAEICNKTEMMRLLDGEPYTSIVNEKLNSLDRVDSAMSLPATINMGVTQEVHLKSYIDSGIDSIHVAYSSLRPSLASGNMRTVDALTRMKLSKLLDPVKAGSDWRELAKQLALQTSIRGFEVQKSPTTALLDSYEVADGTVEELTKCLLAMNRRDAVDLIQESMSRI